MAAITFNDQGLDLDTSFKKLSTLAVKNHKPNPQKRLFYLALL